MDSASPGPVVRATRSLAVATVLALVALGLAWELWLAPTGNRTLALKVLPLLWPFAGLLKYRLVTYRATSLLVWLYVAEGALRVTTERGAAVPLAALEIALALLLFAACAVHVRSRLAAAREAAT